MDLINAAILEQQQQMLASSAAAVAHLLPKALEKLEAALDTGEEWAIKETFERGWGKAVQTNNNNNSGVVEFKVYERTPDFDPNSA